MKVSSLKVMTLTSLLAVSACSYPSDSMFPPVDEEGYQAQTQAVKTSAPSAYRQGANTNANTGKAAPVTTQVPSSYQAAGKAYTYQPEMQSQVRDTIPGQKIKALASEFDGIKAKVAANLSKASQIKTKIKNDVLAYNETVAAVASKLQVGTTPANPLMVEKWEAASEQLEVINQDITALSQVSSAIDTDLTSVAYLLDAIKATYSLAGAVDEDHERLKTLEDAATQKIIVVKRSLSELNENVVRQRQYAASEQYNLGALAFAIRSGRLDGSVTGSIPKGNMKAHPPVVMGGKASPLPGSAIERRNITVKAPAADKNVAVQKAAEARVANKRPLMSIKFAKNNVNYKQALYAAAKRALAKNPDVVLDVVEVAPLKAPLNLNRAKEVANALLELGFTQERVITSGINSEITVPEVRIYLH